MIIHKPYNAATATTDLGVPIAYKSRCNTNNFVRATVQETYNFIINDLKEALADLGPSYPST